MFLDYWDSLLVYDEDPWLYVATMHIMSIVSLLLFQLGVYCVVTKKSSITPTYRKFIILYMIANIASQVCWTSLYLPHLMLPYPAGDTLGLFSIMNVAPEMQLTIQFSLIAALGGVTTLMFGYRYYILLPTGNIMRHKDIVFGELLLLVLFSLIIPPPLFYWCTYSSPYDIIKIRLVKKMGLISPRLFHKETLAFEVTPGSPLFVTIIYLSFCMTVMASTITFFMHRIATFFEKFATFMSPSTRRQHKSLTRMLYVQTTVSFALMVLPFTAFAFFLFFEVGACGILHICFVIYSCADPATTVIMIVMHGPYKRAVIELFYKLTMKPLPAGMSQVAATSNSNSGSQRRPADVAK